MIIKIKSKLRSNEKLLKFFKRYLTKYYSIGSVDPKKNQTGDIDWDLPLVEFLKSLDYFGQLKQGNFLTSSLSHSKAGGSKDGILEFPILLVWLISHYISAPASSHGLGLAYISQYSSSHNRDQLKLVVDAMPTSIKLTAYSCINEQLVSEVFHCGGIQSSFEANDLNLFRHEYGGDKNCAFVIDARGMAEQYFQIIESQLNNQRIIAYIALIVDVGYKPQIPATAQGWENICISGLQDGCDLFLCTNLRWQQELGSINDLKFRDASSSKAMEILKKGVHTIPIISAVKQGHCKQISWPVVELIAGSKLKIFSLDDNCQTQIRSGTTGSFFTTSPPLYQASDVFVSGASVVWKNQCAFSEADLSHDVGRLLDSKVLVGAPTHTLKGKYFLFPTNNPHHSHLIFETLQHLHLISTNCPEAKLLLSDLLSKSQREYFASFGFSEENCVYKHPNETYQVEELYFLGSSEPIFNRRSIQHLKNIGIQAGKGLSEFQERIYLSRRDARIYRNLVNELEVEEIFKAYGFAIVMPSELSAEEKIILFSGAKYIAGALGAAFTYAPFSTNAQLIVLTSNMYFPEMFPQMAALQLSDIFYIRGMGLKLYSDVWGYEHCSFYLPPNLVYDSLQKFLQN